MKAFDTFVGSDGTKIFTFNYEGKPFRVVQDPDDLTEWFLFEDIANILDLIPQALNSLERIEKRTIKSIDDPSIPGKVVVSLSGLNKLADIAKRKEDSLLN